MRTNPLQGELRAPDVSIVLPCLNQARALPFAIANARAALSGLERELGLTGEIILADAGSRDGSQMIAIAEGLHIVDAPCCGYGAALKSGLAGARGRYLVMGDLDGSCDFRDCVAMVRALMRGVDLCVGSRVLGQQLSFWERFWQPLRQPLLSLLLRWFFGVYLTDATCRLRALSASTFRALRLQAAGAEFTTEMIIKAALLGHRISESAVRPRRGRVKRSGRAMLRHLRFVIMLSPAWVFLAPALLLVAGGLCLWLSALLGLGHVVAQWLSLPGGGFVLAGALLCLAHLFSLFALGAHLYASREGFREPPSRGGWVNAFVSTGGQLGLAAGLAVMGVGLLALPLMLETHLHAGLATGVSLLVLALQSAFAAFMVAILKVPEPEEGAMPIEASEMPLVPAEPVRLGM